MSGEPHVASVPVVVVAGEAFAHVLSRFARVDGANVPIDMSAVTVEAGIRFPGEPLATADVVALSVTRPAVHQVTLALTAAQTAELSPGVGYAWYVRDATNDVLWVRGAVRVEARA